MLIYDLTVTRLLLQFFRSSLVVSRRKVELGQSHEIINELQMSLTQQFLAQSFESEKTRLRSCSVYQRGQGNEWIGHGCGRYLIETPLHGSGLAKH